jgi:MarR family transcriptional regulator, organic hydroperoxide resistance regulator
MSDIDWNTISQFEGPEQSPGFLLWQASTQWRRLIESALATLGLTHPQFVLLASVGWMTRNRGQVTQVELARHCKTDINMTSQVLRTLERKGYIKRHQCQGNERSKFPLLTSKGAQLIEQAIPLVEAVDRAFFKNLESDIGTCIKLLQSMGLTRRSIE